MKRFLVLIPIVLLLISAASEVAAQCGTPVPTWTPTPTYEGIVLGTQSAHLIAYFPLNETTGTVADDLSGASADGTYSGTTLNATTFLNGDAAPSFDGVNDYVDFYSSAFETNFDPTSGTLMAWAKADPSIWTDGTQRFVARVAVITNTEVHIRRSTVNGQMAATYMTKVLGIGASSTSNWMQLAITWDKAGDAVKIYYNGIQQGSTLTGLGTWSGSLDSSGVLIGSRLTNGAGPWVGNIAHVAIWDTPLSSTEISDLYSVPSPSSPTPTVQPTCTIAPGSTETPTITPTADLFSFWTAVPPETTGTPEPGQPFGFGYVATAGQVGIAVMLAAILFVLIAVSVISFLRRRT